MSRRFVRNRLSKQVYKLYEICQIDHKIVLASVFQSIFLVGTTDNQRSIWILP